MFKAVSTGETPENLSNSQLISIVVKLNPTVTVILVRYSLQHAWTKIAISCVAQMHALSVYLLLLQQHEFLCGVPFHFECLVAYHTWGTSQGFLSSPLDQATLKII